MNIVVNAKEVWFNFHIVIWSVQMEVYTFIMSPVDSKPQEASGEMQKLPADDVL